MKLLGKSRVTRWGIITLKRTVTRQISSAWLDLTDSSGLMVGMRYFHDVPMPRTRLGTPAAVYYNGQPSISYDDIAGFAQYDLDTRWVNLSVGGRYEYYSAVGGHFVPRIALTKAWKKFHLKALYSQASRIPGINVVQAAVGGKIEAEQTANYELEAGYRFTEPGRGWPMCFTCRWTTDHLYRRPPAAVQRRLLQWQQNQHRRLGNRGALRPSQFLQLLELFLLSRRGQ